jgi:phosphinothricin acetyltransferase
MPPVIRPATVADAPALLAIYRPYVERTAVSFETEPPTVEQFAARIAKSLEGWAWLVAEVDGVCAGYAYGTAHRERAAYRLTVETSAYLDEGFHRQGLGRALYEELLRRLTAMGFHRAVAGITLPNEGSVALHEALGFERIGVYKEVGFKFGAWHDSVWYQRGLA